MQTQPRSNSRYAKMLGCGCPVGRPWRWMHWPRLAGRVSAVECLARPVPPRRSRGRSVQRSSLAADRLTLELGLGRGCSGGNGARVPNPSRAPNLAAELEHALLGLHRGRGGHAEESVNIISTKSSVSLKQSFGCSLSSVSISRFNRPFHVKLSSVLLALNGCA